MRVVIDTSILCQDYLLQKPHFRVLIDGCLLIPAKIYIPEVVIDELVNRFSEDLYEVQAQLQRATKEIATLTNRPETPGIAVEREVAKYREYIYSKIKGEGIEILPYPDIPHKKIVERDLARRKPFKRNGSGYRDTLIWETVKRLMLWGEHQTIFLTNNSSDFGAGPLADPELQKDIHNVQNLKIYGTLKQFSDQYIMPRLRSLDETKNLLQANKLDGFDLHGWLRSDLLKLLRKDDLESVLAGFPDGAGSAWVREIVEFSEIKVDQVKALENNKNLITASVKFVGSCSISSNWNDYSRYIEVQEFWGKNTEPFDSASVMLDEDISATIDLVIDSESWMVDSSELISIEGQYGEMDFGRW